MPRRFVGRAARWVLGLALAAGAASPAAAQEHVPARVAVLTFGPGDHPFFKFGHNAILVEDAQGEGIVFNWGTFSFDTPMLIPKFLRGRLKYWLSISPRDPTLAHYQEENRTVEVQELDLSEAERRALLERLLENARPHNREYLYDYFWDNCSTRVRDAVDAAVGGAVREAARAPAVQSQRAHALRMTADLFPEYLGLHFGLGALTDAPSSLWEESFLPERFRDLLDKVQIPAEGGGRKPLVKAREVRFKAARPDKPAQPPAWVLGFAVAGLCAGGLLAVLGLLARRRAAARVALGVGTSLLGLVFGLLGLVLVLLWAVTNHRVAWANQNMLQTAPWALALVVYGVGVARGRARANRRAFLVAASLAAASLLGLVVKVVPAFFQDNTAFIAFFLPLWAGLTLACKQLPPAAAFTDPREPG